MSRQSRFRQRARATGSDLYRYRQLDPAQQGQVQAGAINAYGCSGCNQLTVTVHVDAGTTPMFLQCRTTPGCDGRAVSLMYRPLGRKEQPAFEWYRPAEREFLKLDRGTQHHVALGGLLLRPVTNPEENSDG